MQRYKNNVNREQSKVKNFICSYLSCNFQMPQLATFRVKTYYSFIQNYIDTKFPFSSYWKGDLNTNHFVV